MARRTTAEAATVNIEIDPPDARAPYAYAIERYRVVVRNAAGVIISESEVDRRDNGVIPASFQADEGTPVEISVTAVSNMPGALPSPAFTIRYTVGETPDSAEGSDPEYTVIRKYYPCPHPSGVRIVQ